MQYLKFHAASVQHARITPGQTPPAASIHASGSTSMRVPCGSTMATARLAVMTSFPPGNTSPAFMAPPPLSLIHI